MDRQTDKKVEVQNVFDIQKLRPNLFRDKLNTDGLKSLQKSIEKDRQTYRQTT